MKVMTPTQKLARAKCDPWLIITGCFLGALMGQLLGHTLNLSATLPRSLEDKLLILLAMLGSMHAFGQWKRDRYFPLAVSLIISVGVSLFGYVAWIGAPKLGLLATSALYLGFGATHWLMNRK